METEIVINGGWVAFVAGGVAFVAGGEWENLMNRGCGEMMKNKSFKL